MWNFKGYFPPRILEKYSKEKISNILGKIGKYKIFHALEKISPVIKFSKDPNFPKSGIFKDIFSSHQNLIFCRDMLSGCRSYLHNQEFLKDIFPRILERFLRTHNPFLRDQKPINFAIAKKVEILEIFFHGRRLKNECRIFKY